MPALVNSRVGSLAGTSGLDGTMVCPLRSKYFKNRVRISLLFIDTSCIQSSCFEIAAQHLADHLGIEPALLQKARLACMLAETRRRLGKSLEPSGTGTRELGFCCAAASLRHNLARH